MIPEILLVYGSSQLGCSFSRSYRDLSLVNISNSWKIFRCSEIAVASEAGNLPPLSIIHFISFYSSVVISSQFLDPYLPVIQLSKQSIDLVIQCSDLVLRSGPILYLFHLFNNICGNLFPPFLAFMQIVDFSDMSESSWSLVILSVD